MQIDVITSVPTAEGNTLVVPLTQADLSERLHTLADRFGLPHEPLQRGFKAEARETVLTLLPPGTPFDQLAMLGIGAPAGPVELRAALRTLVHRQRGRGLASIVLDLTNAPFRDTDEPERTVQACVEGCLLGAYAIDRFKTHRGPASDLERLALLVPEAWQADSGTAVSRGEALASAQQFVFDLVNGPSNEITPTALAEAATASGARHGYEVTVLSGDEIAGSGLYALQAVSRGSTAPPACIVMEYRPPDAEGAGVPTIGLVGKGVTFDTGGISLKESTNLWYMKCDMAGGAAVIGAVEAAARMRLPVHVVGIVPATENKPDGSALNPGDIINTLAGLTVEVEDTDAEGRLILADGLAYLNRHFKPDVMIDIATLTGACVMALGYHAAGLLTPNDELAAALTAAGERTGERVWRLPLWDVYDSQISSDIADVKNLGGKPAGAITAASFLKKFAADHPAWAHLDIAGTAFTDSDFARGKSSTAFGVRLLVEYMEAHARAS